MTQSSIPKKQDKKKAVELEVEGVGEGGLGQILERGGGGRQYVTCCRKKDHPVLRFQPRFDVYNLV